LITPPVLPEKFEDQLAAALDEGDVAAVQIRLRRAGRNLTKNGLAISHTTILQRFVPAFEKMLESLWAHDRTFLACG
jgi:hypothetical protein